MGGLAHGLCCAAALAYLLDALCARPVIVAGDAEGEEVVVEVEVAAVVLGGSSGQPEVWEPVLDEDVA